LTLSWSFPQVITYSSRHVYNNLTEEQNGRVAFASNFLAGDASLQIEPLKPSDEGQYTCKVKNSGRYVWNYVILKVLGKVGHQGKCLHHAFLVF
jgi:adipocyte-specific adhesion protein